MNKALNIKSFRGKAVELLLIDPWEFVSETGSGPFHAVIVDVEPDERKMLLEVQPPLLYKSVECKYFVAVARHEGSDLLSPSSGNITTCNLTHIPPNRVIKSANPFDLSWWRGGIAIIADVRKT
jgi:hypothetical protein